jgi:hypothetical protein
MKNTVFHLQVICSSETSVDFQRTTRSYIPEDSILHNHRCENLKSYINKYVKSTCLWLNSWVKMLRLQG